MEKGGVGSEGNRERDGKGGRKHKAESKSEEKQTQGKRNGDDKEREQNGKKRCCKEREEKVDKEK